MPSQGTLLQNRYQIVQVLTDGSQSEHYQATDLRLQAPVLIHSLSWPTTAAGDAAIASVARIAALQHPAIPTIFDTFREGDRLFLVRHFIPGRSLAAALAQNTRPFEIARALPWIDHLLDLLAYLHEHSPAVILGTLSPELLYLTDDGQIMLSDPGVLLKQLPTYIVEHNSALHSPYVPPERIRGETLGPRSNLFALAATAYHLLSGTAPAEATHRELERAAGRADPLIALHLLNPHLPPAVATIIDQALVLETDQRPASARSLRQELHTALANLGDLQSASVTQDHRFGSEEPTILQAVTPPHNLSIPDLPIVGRTEAVADLRAMLQQPAARLITVTGAGGTGKTRLAMQVAMELIGAAAQSEQIGFRDGIFFVALPPIREPGLLFGAIARALELQETGDQPIETVLQSYLQGRSMLLILDNFEQLMTAAPQLMQLMDGSTHLVCLVTSREALRVRGERVFPLAPLALPDLGQLPSITELLAYPAVDLFVQRAQVIRPDFTLDQTNARTVAAICVRLDGLPLAIELAAARIRLLTPQALLERLGSRLKLLTGGARDIPARQQTLRATIDWSYQLLGPAEQQLFRRLSVFVGGGSLSTAEVICNAEGDELDTLDALTSLLDKHLLYRNHQAEEICGEPYVMMLETIWEFARELLHASGEAETQHRAHAAYYAAQAQRADCELRGPEQALWLKQLDLEHDNFRAALAWAASPAGDVELGFQICGRLWQFWQPRGFLREGREQVARLIHAASDRPPTDARADALTTAGILAHFQGDLVAAQALYEQALPIRRAVGSPAGIAGTLNNLGIIAMDRGNYAEARSLYQQCLAVEREIGDEHGIAGSLMNIGNIAYFQNDYAEAAALHEEALAIGRKLGAKQIIAYALGNLGGVAFDLGDFAAARAYCAESVEIEREIGDQWGIANSLNMLGDAVCAQDDLATARAAYAEALSLMRTFGDKRLLTHIFESIGGLALKQGDADRSTRLIGSAVTLRATIGVPPTVAELRYREVYLEQARIALGAELFDRTWAAGTAMSLEQAIELAARITS